MVPKSAKFRKFFICHSQATLVVYKNREENPLSRETTGSPKEVKDTLVVFRIWELLNLTDNKPVDPRAATYKNHLGSSGRDINKFVCLEQVSLMNQATHRHFQNCKKWSSFNWNYTNKRTFVVVLMILSTKVDTAYVQMFWTVLGTNGLFVCLFVCCYTGKIKKILTSLPALASK